MFGTVSSWLGVTKPDANSPSQSPTKDRPSKTVMEAASDTNPAEEKLNTESNGDTTTTKQVDDIQNEVPKDEENKAEESTEDTKKDIIDLTPEEIQKQLDEVSQKAIQSAKEWGSMHHCYTIHNITHASITLSI